MRIRVTGIMIEKGSILLLNQDVDAARTWSLPGGKVEENETLENALVRELKEETGLKIEVQRLLYVCDYITDNAHVVHMTFQVKRTGGEFGITMEGLDLNDIREVAFVPIAELTGKGFSQKFQNIVTSGFPDAGSYMGPKSAIGL